MNQLQALIIDDNHANLGVLSRLLSKQGIVSTVISDVNQLDHVLENLAKVDIAFVDLELPEINGYEILAKLKADVRFEAIPIVAYTVHVSEINVAHHEGFHSFLAKPVDTDKFPEQLAKILSGEHVWSS